MSPTVSAPIVVFFFFFRSIATTLFQTGVQQIDCFVLKEER